MGELAEQTAAVAKGDNNVGDSNAVAFSVLAVCGIMLEPTKNAEGGIASSCCCKNCSSDDDAIQSSILTTHSLNWNSN